MAAADKLPENSAPNAFRSAIIPAGRLLPGILGLRGIAALAVVLFHLVHLASISAPGPFTFIAADFGKGVHLFFVLSAFSLMHSTEHTMSCRAGLMNTSSSASSALRRSTTASWPA